MSASGIIGTFQGVRSPGTAYVLLHHYMGEIDGAFRAWGIPKGGTGGISNAIAGAARAPGASRSGPRRRSREIVVRDGRATGVALESGEEIQADVGPVARSTPRRTFLDLLEPGTLDADFEAEVRRFRFRGSSGKVNLALDAPARLHGLPGRGRAPPRRDLDQPARIDDMERAYDDAKYGRFSRRPYIDIIIPTLVDPSMAPPGKHVMSCFVQYAPYHLDPALGTWDDNREAFGDAVVDRIAEFAPNIRDVILHRQVLTPLDIERDDGPHRGQHLPGRAVASSSCSSTARCPAGRASGRRSRDLWLCGSATHPGGGIMGATGRIAALELLRSRGKRVA